MRFRQVHKLVSYLLVVAAVGTLMTSAVVPLPTLVLMAGAVAVSWFVEPTTPLGRLVDRSGLLPNAAALAFFGLSLYQVVDSFPEPDLTPILNLVMFLVAYKLFQRRANRDYLQLYILSFLLVLAGAWLAQSAVFVLAFAAYVVLTTWTLILFHLRREIEDNYLVKHLPEAGSEKVTVVRVLNSRRVVGRSFFVATGLVAATVFVGAAIIFALVPRIGIGFFAGTLRRRVNIVGFSDQVRLGYHGVLSGENQTVILRAEVPRIAAIKDANDRDLTVAQLYWRGTVYDTYVNQGSWADWGRSERPETRTKVDRDPDPTSDPLYFPMPRELPNARRPTRADLKGLDVQEIQMVALTYPIAFAIDQPIAFETPARRPESYLATTLAGDFGGVFRLQLERTGPDGQPAQTIRDFMGAKYTAYSRDPLRLRGPPPIQGLPIEEIREQMAPYLTVPKTLSPRVREHARKITEGYLTPLAKVGAIVRWLQSTHTYTTLLQRNPKIADPLEDFLFHQNAGHCEYFASAAVILMRLAGIPSRYVNGFLGGEWNDLGQYITVRDNRAHSWAEAYIGRLGWIRVDATPTLTTPTRMGRLFQLYDAIERYWMWWVIDYDVSRQMDLARKLGRGLGLGRAVPMDTRAFKRAALKVVAVIALAAIIWAALRFRRMLRFREARGPVWRPVRGGAAIVRLYESALARLARVGWTRSPHETPREFASRLAAAEHADSAALTALTEHYARARYGGHEVTAETLATLEAAVAGIGKGARPAEPPQKAA